MNFNAELFLKNADALGIAVTDAQLSLFENYAAALVEKNKVMNLTAITDADGIAVKHFADCVSLLKVIGGKPSKIIDIGTGAGFPGIPLLIMNPSLSLILLDSTGKKLSFIADFLDSQGLKAKIIHGRAEDIAAKHSERETYDFAVSRAVANLATLSEYCLPFVKTGGSFIAMKSEKADEEIAGAKTAIKTLGGEIKETIDINLTDGAVRKLIVVKKITRTPPKYPRPNSKINW